MQEVNEAADESEGQGTAVDVPVGVLPVDGVHDGHRLYIAWSCSSCACCSSVTGSVVGGPPTL